ncbi:MAG: tRNA 5-methoxyuridine(34)/uridine 5-oxyacetic acid(34) synthase CmoB [Candidatus Dasytiphilus stammeri]
MNFNSFYKILIQEHFLKWLEILPTQLNKFKSTSFKGLLKDWYKIVLKIPIIIPELLDLKNNITAINNNICNNTIIMIEKLLQRLVPWRKGPFFLYGINIDAEWCSNLKWERVFKHISSLAGRRVLDVGCGNGYYLLRMLGADAKLTIGVDPNLLSCFQFQAIKKLLGNNLSAYLLPLSLEQLPSSETFDTVFSMGVIYHKRSPLDHLRDLKNQLISGGELILETLILTGEESKIFMPSKRYANMRNIWFIPSATALTIWLDRCGFQNIRIVDYTKTTSLEQRCTSWANVNSLSDCLDPKNANQTIEGYPAPLRAIIIARKS